MTIDIGAVATDRATWFGTGYTILSADNPANGDGTINVAEIWADTNIEGCVVGTFYLVSAGVYKCRASASIGAVTAGAKRTTSGLSIAVKTGDLFGIYYSTGRVERDTINFAGVHYFLGDATTPDQEETYSFFAGDAVSCYGTGIESAGKSKGLIIG